MVIRSGWLAAALSFVLPGLGQVSLGRVRRGVLVAIPAVATFGVALAVVLSGPNEMLDLFVRPEVVIAFLVANAVLALYHVLAIVDAYRIASALRPASTHRRLTIVLVGLLVATTVGVHGAIGWVGADASSTLDAVLGGDPAAVIPEASFEPADSAPVAPSPTDTIEPTATPTPWPAWSPPTASSLTASPTPTPTPTPLPTPTQPPTPRAPALAEQPPTPDLRLPPWARDGRLDLLLMGADSGPDRWSLRTDTLIVLSIDTATGRAALFGVPRNMVGVPLAPESAKAFAGGRFPGLINALYVYAMSHPGDFPGGANRGFRAVSGAVQELLGIRLDGLIVVNLAGFVGLVDAVGGLWIDVPERVVDANYPLEDGSGWISLDIEPGCQHLSGRMALAYARSRHQDSDYGRMERQQRVLAALRRQLDPLSLVAKVPKLLSIARDDLWTTISRTDAPELASLAARVDARRIESTLFAPSRYAAHVDDLEIATIRSVVRTVFDHPAPARSPIDPGAHCP